jgi:hydroxymethyl cephem carbamoyltransferase
MFALADPSFPEERRLARFEDAGKLMALAAFGDAADASSAIRETVDRILAPAKFVGPLKRDFRDSPVYNAGVESEAHKVGAALITERIFSLFAGRHPTPHLRRLRPQLRLERDVE